MLLTKTSEACLDLSLPSCTNGDVAQVLEELHSGVVLAGLLRREERVHLAPCLRLALSQCGKILLASLCSLLFPPGLLSCSVLGLSPSPLLGALLGAPEELTHGP
jgi:hypothetical protein